MLPQGFISSFVSFIHENCCVLSVVYPHWLWFISLFQALSSLAHFIVQFELGIEIECGIIAIPKMAIKGVEELFSTDIWNHLPGSAEIDSFCSSEDTTLRVGMSIGKSLAWEVANNAVHHSDCHLINDFDRLWGRESWLTKLLDQVWSRQCQTPHWFWCELCTGFICTT